MDKHTIQNIARQVLSDLHYKGWEVSAVWQQKAISMPKSAPENGHARKTWYIDFTNDQGSFPRVYFHCGANAEEEWVRSEIRQQLQNLRGKLTFMDPVQPASPTTIDDEADAASAALPERTTSAPTEPASKVIAPNTVRPNVTPKITVTPPEHLKVKTQIEIPTEQNIAPLPPAPPSPVVLVTAPLRELTVQESNPEELNTSLLRAAAEGQTDVVKSLLEQGANVNARMGNGMTALIRAAFFGHADVVRLLLTENADHSAKDQLGMTAFDWALSKDQIEVIKLFSDGSWHTAPAPLSSETVEIVPETSPEVFVFAPPVTHLEPETEVAPPVSPVFEEPPSQTDVAIPTDRIEEEVNQSNIEQIETPLIHHEQTDQPVAHPVIADETIVPPQRKSSALYYVMAAVFGGLIGFLVFYGLFSLRKRDGSSSVVPSNPTAITQPQTQNPAPASNINSSRTVNTGDASTSTTNSPATNKNAVVQPDPNHSKTSQPPAEKKKNTVETQSVAPAGANTQAALNSALDEWVMATNNRDVKKQMSFYAPKVNTFYRDRNVSRDDVQAEKARLFGQAKAVDIRTDKPEIKVDRTGKTATMRFRKKYQIAGGGDERRGEVIQELQWRKTDSGWKIVGERDVQVVH